MVCVCLLLLLVSLLFGLVNVVDLRSVCDL